MVFGQRGYRGQTKPRKHERMLKVERKEQNNEQVTERGSEQNWVEENDGQYT
jgi:hypothetical protein